MKLYIASEITVSLHDAVIDQFRFEIARGRLEVIIWEGQEDRSISWWQLTISGISDKKDVQQTFAAINAILAKERRSSLGLRIDEFNCKKQPASENGAAYNVNLFIDSLTPLRIECAKCTLLSLNSE